MPLKLPSRRCLPQHSASFIRTSHCPASDIIMKSRFLRPMSFKTSSKCLPPLPCCRSYFSPPQQPVMPCFPSSFDAHALAVVTGLACNSEDLAQTDEHVDRVGSYILTVRNLRAGGYQVCKEPHISNHDQDESSGSVTSSDCACHNESTRKRTNRPPDDGRIAWQPSYVRPVPLSGAQREPFHNRRDDDNEFNPPLTCPMVKSSRALRHGRHPQGKVQTTRISSCKKDCSGASKPRSVLRASTVNLGSCRIGRNQQSGTGLYVVVHMGKRA